MKKNVLLLKNITKEKAGSKVLDQFYVEILSGEIMNLIGLEAERKRYILSCSVMNVRIRERYGLRERSMKKGRNCPSKDPTGYFLSEIKN